VSLVSLTVRAALLGVFRSLVRPRCSVTAPVNLVALASRLRGTLNARVAPDETVPADQASTVLPVAQQALDVCQSSHESSVQCLLVTWRPVSEWVGTPTTEYRLDMKVAEVGRSTGHATSQFACIYRGASDCFLLAAPIPGAKYSFRVTALNQVGTSKPSPVFTLRCSGMPPAPVAAPVLVSPACTSIQVSWQAPECNGGVITSYAVRYVQGDEPLEAASQIDVHRTRSAEASLSTVVTRLTPHTRCVPLVCGREAVTVSELWWCDGRCVLSLQVHDLGGGHE